MNTNMNMNGRRKRRSVDSKQEELDKMKMVFDNSTLIATEFDLNFENNNNNNNEELLENLHGSFHQCQTKIQNMDLNCEENIILTSWDMMRKMKDNNFCTMPPPPPPNSELISNPTESFIYNFINLKHKKYLLKDKC